MRRQPMKFSDGLVLLITFLLTFLSVANPAIIRADQGDSKSYLTRLSRDSLAGLFPEALGRSKFDETLYQCHYQNQPVIPKSRRMKGPQSRLRGLCNREAFVRDIFPKRARKQHGGKHLLQGAEDREALGELVEIPASEYSEARDGLYTVLTETKVNPVREHVDASSAVAETAYSTFNSSEPVNMTLGNTFTLALKYNKLRNSKPASPDCADPDEMLSYFGHYYLNSKGFKRFLEWWERSTSNSRYYISQDDVDRIREEVCMGTRFQELSIHSKQLFGRLFFVRNALEIYGTIRFVMRPLGLASNVYRTAEDFLQALYRYLMAVHESNGRLGFESPVTSSLVAAEFFNFCYAECYTPSVGDLPKYSRGERDCFSDAERHSYIESLIVLFKAWCKSTKTYIDPAVLSDVADEFYSYVKRDKNYNYGC